MIMIYDDDSNEVDDVSDDEDDDDWWLCCNCSILLHLANWFNNELISSSLDFNCFCRKYTSSSIWGRNALERII